MKLRALRYLFVLEGPLIGGIGLYFGGLWSWGLPIYVFGIIPLMEIILPAPTSNFSSEEEKAAKNEPLFDLILYFAVFLQVAWLIYFLFRIGDEGLAMWEFIGMTVSMGIGCGVLGINVAHELGHRKKPHEKIMARLMLLTSLYMHFVIEHNLGHHVKVSTPEDPASARRGESLYGFWLRSIFLSYLSAWKIEIKRLKKNGRSFLSIHNEMLLFQIIHASVLIIIAITLGWTEMFAFIGAAAGGILLLETVNYIEHYGLSRKPKGNGLYEKVEPHHSWNSNHLMGRLVLFELSRHSDHHYSAGRKYQILRHFDNSPQMPLGYPGMMVLATIPPLWFKIMDPLIDKTEAQYQTTS